MPVVKMWANQMMLEVPDELRKAIESRPEHKSDKYNSS